MAWIEERAPFADQPVTTDPLSFAGYGEQLGRARSVAGTDESVTCGRATIGGTPVVVAEFAFGFLGGSMGEAAGLRLAHAMETAIELRVPLVTVAASGGARMQEGMRSLLQMQRVAAGLADLRRAGVPHLAVAAHPTTGGVWASLAAAADVIVGVAGATVAFAGARLRGDDGADDGDAFRAEGKLAAGAIDCVVTPAELADTVAAYVRVLAAATRSPADRCPPPAALPGALDQGEGWGAVLLARAAWRPRADAYLDAHFDGWVEISGDRCGGRDAGMACGFGLRDGQVVAFAAQRGTANTPAGFRTVVRLLALAEAWQLPVLTLIDTPGAANDAAAEDAGLGTAIAQTFAALASASVPVTSLVIGEGGSGGALALADPQHLWAVPSSYFSVIAPEGAAAILLRDRSRAAELADRLHLDPAALVELRVLRGVVGATATAPAVASEAPA